MTPEYLKELLPSLLNADFAGATNVRLLSLARTYAALCDLATFDFPSGEYGTRKIWLQRIDTLFGVLRDGPCHVYARLRDRVRRRLEKERGLFRNGRRTRPGLSRW